MVGQSSRGKALCAIGIVLAAFGSAVHAHGADHVLQKRARAAIAFADGLFPPDTPDHAAAIRLGLEAATSALAAPSDAVLRDLEPEMSKTVPAFKKKKADQDPLFRNNLQRSILDLTKEEEPRPRIYGGRRVVAGFDFVVAITGPWIDDTDALRTGRSFGLCTGVLIAPNLVLSAAHCLDVFTPRNAAIGGNPFAIGSPSVPIDPKGLKHPNGLDLVLLTSKRAFQDVVPVKFLLSTGGAPEVKIVGYGETYDGPSYGVKHEVDVVVATWDCTGTVSVFGKQIARSVYYGCAERKEFVAVPAADTIADACQGDSGGPALIQVHGDTVSWSLVGIIRKNVEGSLRCGEGGVFVKITKEVARWIGQNS